VDTYAQDLQHLFQKAYPKALQGSEDFKRWVNLHTVIILTGIISITLLHNCYKPWYCHRGRKPVLMRHGYKIWLSLDLGPLLPQCSIVTILSGQSAGARRTTIIKSNRTDGWWEKKKPSEMC